MAHQRADEGSTGFGSFHNHFTSKVQLFQVALAEVLERGGR